MTESQVLFISSDSYASSQLVSKLYSLEAEKMDVSWLGIGKTIESANDALKDIADPDSFLSSFGYSNVEEFTPPEILKVEDINNASIAIYLKPANSQDVLKNSIPSAKGKYEVWEFDSIESLLETAKANLSKLLVLLIMKGGKRTPLAPEEPKAGEKSPPKDNGKVRVCLEKKKRRGKKVTTITGLPLEEKDLYKLAASLKQSCGTGGTVKNDCIEIQGNQCDKILAELNKLGYRAKRSGG